MPQIRPNVAKEKLRKNQVVTTISGLQNADVIDFLGPMGFDAGWIECEHGPVDWEGLGDMTRTCDLWGMTSITRVSANEPWLITHTLDRGSMLEMCRVNGSTLLDGRGTGLSISYIHIQGQR